MPNLKERNFHYTYNETHGTGKIDFLVNLYFKDGNAVQLRDKVLILDPKNPVEIRFDATKNNPQYPDSVHVAGTIKTKGVSGTIRNVQLKRICYYGKEEGIHPLAEPNGNPNDPNDAFYSKFKGGKADDFIKHETIYEALKEGIPVDSPLKWDPVEENFTFDDPMPYFNEKGEVESEGFKWDYAKFDREAWKYIKRKKYFDLKKAVAIEYIVSANAVIDSEEKTMVDSAIEVGIPYLSTVPMAQFCMWVKECAMNRLWHMQIPRYCWKKTISWLPSSQNIRGDVSGSLTYWVNIVTQSGGGGIYDYSDWPSVKIYTNEDLYIAASSKVNVRRQISANLTVVPDPKVWDRVQFVIDGIGVRDYTLQWGLCTDGGVTGGLKLKRKGGEEELVDGETLKSFMPTYSESGWTPQPGYGYDDFDYGDAKHAKDHVATWTKINFLYAPTLAAPVEWGEWAEHEYDWEVHYAVE